MGRFRGQLAKRTATKTTDQYTHPSAKRANLPTEQTGKTMSDTDRQPILHVPETRGVDDEPILAWNRQTRTVTPHIPYTCARKSTLPHS